ncbi:hypothetical protein A2Y83_01940 [Candidatus Falkowbacteria bacterium RBG_13_39_14]|uniref:Pyruvate kinase barrel domain-containing protein n=1 Tax=Candidatus Falkowbacteria bacterium RBG_13_39_14 TaxID=1797985 RepID=A0A1F5S1E4_9BACT|nr:MAG: hypothetical protein A2Y83_01940 [Candidatus Falkowbacteria bacterium RBG_13_39_14]
MESSVNAPDVHINLPSLTKKDREYILFAIENGVDFISHSFSKDLEFHSDNPIVDYLAKCAKLGSFTPLGT